MTRLPDWLEPQRVELEALELQGRMPHALLLEGSRGWGTEALAEHVVATWLKLDGNLREVIHPDLYWIEPQRSDSGPIAGISRPASPSSAQGRGHQSNLAIRIEEIRECLEFISGAPQSGLVRCAVILQAETLTPQAANAMLKTLEEPPKGGRLVLVSEKPFQLLPTVSSRCRRVRVNSPASDVTKAWLEARYPDANGLEMYSRELGNSPFAIAGAIEDGSALLREFLLAVWKSSGDITGLDEWNRGRKENRPSGVAALGIMEVLDRWQRIVHHLARNGRDPLAACQFYARLVEAKRLFQDIPGLNRRIQLERLLIHWKDLGRVLQAPRNRAS